MAIRNEMKNRIEIRKLRGKNVRVNESWQQSLG